MLYPPPLVILPDRLGISFFAKTDDCWKYSNHRGRGAQVEAVLDAEPGLEPVLGVEPEG
jgi:hypothetical protein